MVRSISRIEMGVSYSIWSSDFIPFPFPSLPQPKRDPHHTKSVSVSRPPSPFICVIKLGARGGGFGGQGIRSADTFRCSNNNTISHPFFSWKARSSYPSLCEKSAQYVQKLNSISRIPATWRYSKERGKESRPARPPRRMPGRGLPSKLLKSGTRTKRNEIMFPHFEGFFSRLWMWLILKQLFNGATPLRNHSCSP